MGEDNLFLIVLALSVVSVTLLAVNPYSTNTLEELSGASIQADPAIEEAKEELSAKVKPDYFAEYDRRMIDTFITIISLVLAGVVLLGIRYARHHEHRKHIKFKPVHKRYRPL